MGKSWDKALPDKKVWAECLRVLKPGAFAFVMSIPRSDCLSRMIISIEEAGFMVNFTPIFWTYATGMPKAQNISKVIDKKFVVGSEAKALDGSYAGFSPKPAVEVIIVAMKPLSEKTYVNQALNNRHGITWLDDCRIPYKSEDKPSDMVSRASVNSLAYSQQEGGGAGVPYVANDKGRFPANIICSNDTLNDGKVTKGSGGNKIEGKKWHNKEGIGGQLQKPINDLGSFSRYFSLDAWWDKKLEELPESVKKTFPFLIVSKANKSERNKGLTGGTGSNTYNRKCLNCGKWQLKQGLSDNYTCHCKEPVWEKASGNLHPTVKPIKLMSYLIMLGSREGDVVLDPFIGSGSTAITCKILGRDCIGYEIDKNYFDIAIERMGAFEDAI